MAASTRDGGSGRDRNPIERIIRLVKKLFTFTVYDVTGETNTPAVPHP
jgi:hypothetical protein